MAVENVIALKLRLAEGALGRERQRADAAEQEIIRLRVGEAAIARVREVHSRGDSGSCTHCSENDYPDYDAAWPCATIRALDGEDTNRG